MDSSPDNLTLKEHRFYRVAKLILQQLSLFPYMRFHAQAAAQLGRGRNCSCIHQIKRAKRPAERGEGVWLQGNDMITIMILTSTNFTGALRKVWQKWTSPEQEMRKKKHMRADECGEKTYESRQMWRKKHMRADKCGERNI